MKDMFDLFKFYLFELKYFELLSSLVRLFYCDITLFEDTVRKTDLDFIKDPIVFGRKCKNSEKCN